MAKMTIRWKAKPDKHDYAAAASYLSLTMTRPAAKAIAKKLKRAPMSQHPAKDIFRASRLPLLLASNSHVRKDEQRITAHEQMSPLTLYRDERNGILVIADGYHRVSLAYNIDPFLMVPLRLG